MKNLLCVALCLCFFHWIFSLLDTTTALNDVDKLNQTFKWTKKFDENASQVLFPVYLNVTNDNQISTTTFPSIEENIDDIVPNDRPVSKLKTNLPIGRNRRTELLSSAVEAIDEEIIEPIVVKKESFIQKVKDFFKSPFEKDEHHSADNNGGTVFTEKYGGVAPVAQMPLYQGYFTTGYGHGNAVGGGGSGYSGTAGGYSGTASGYSGAGGYGGAQTHPALRPDGGYAPVFKPEVTLELTADFIELNCGVHGRIQQGIRWVKLVQGLNSYGHQLFATVADGERILFDTYHFGVRTDGRKSRLIIRNPDPRTHYGIYQCQVSVAGNPSLIVKEDFIVGKIA
ncbi:hypothetical protein CHUAL_011941 [Chamberlinius hualienensis]